MYQLVSKPTIKRIRNVTKSVRQHRMNCSLGGEGGQITPEGRTKLLRVLEWMRKAGDSLVKINKSDIDISVDTVNSDLTAPAVTAEEANNLIKIRVGGWYVNSASYGQLAGMLAHELGVHHATSQMMNDQQKGKEEDQSAKAQSIRLGHENYVVKAWEGYDDNRQRDHVMAGQGAVSLLRGVSVARGTAGESVRGQYYAALVNRLGEAINLSTVITPEQRQEAMKDLLDSYLFDNARFVVTDDDMKSVLMKPGRVASGMNSQGEIVKNSRNWGNWAKNENVNTMDADKSTPYKILIGAGMGGLIEKIKQNFR